jgi:hypothetical protein
MFLTADTYSQKEPERRLKGRKSQGNTGSLWKSGFTALTKLTEALTRVPIMPRSTRNTQIKDVNPLYGTWDSVRLGTHREASFTGTNKRAL